MPCDNKGNNIKNQMIHHWHLVFTKPRQEYRAALNLSLQGFEVYLPMRHKEVLRQNNVYRVEEPLFKRYLFVRFDEELSPWHKIRNTLGVTDLVRFSNVLATIPDEMIDALKRFKVSTSEMFIKGEVLKITDGPFKNLEVIYQLKDGNQRAIVLIEMLNKIQRIAIDLKDLKKT